MIPIPRVPSDPSDVSEEEWQQKSPPKKRGHPRNNEEGEEPLPKRGRMRKLAGSDQGSHSPRTKPKRQSKVSSLKPRPTGIKGRTRKKVDPLPEASEAETDENFFSEIDAPGSNARQHQRRKLDDVFEDEKRGEPVPHGASSNPDRVRLDSIPPEGIVIRKKNGIVERLLPPATCAPFRFLRMTES